ncbi:probable G-protein coupled receptor No9 [Mercenaria mercenaria]|uniref:probable G-protein coupled receptor No9 n=1 Tax=Mercenaria mercenaria TaxID=6596 RepID=UPI00234F17BB|nr:probable G-protein coupled receptor No9 [Mercenaria mercenaria]
MIILLVSLVLSIIEFKCLQKNELATIKVEFWHILDTKMNTNNTNDSKVQEVINVRLTSDWVTNEYISISLVAVSVPFIFCSNIIVLLSVIKFKRLQIPTNFFIMSLAAADIVIAITLPFYITVELTPIKISDDTLCLAANRILMTAGGVSIITLATIAYDRFTAITYPLKYILLMKKRKIIGFILFSWLYSSFICWIPVIFGLHGNVRQHSSQCSNSVLNRKSRMLFISAIFTPACALILFFYFKIFRIARHHAHAIAAVENSIRSTLERQFVKSDTKYAKTIAIVIGVFLCLWLPYQICLLLTFIGYSEQNQWVNNYLMLLAFFNSGVNPWVYAYQNSDFRSAYKKLKDSWKCKYTIDIEDRRTSVISTISVIPSSSTSARLNRANSRVLASDILYTLSRQIGTENIEHVLDRRLSARHSVINAVSSLPDLLKLYANTYNKSTATDVCILEDLQEDPLEKEGSNDSAYPPSDTISCNLSISSGEKSDKEVNV